uniref:Uncharacterized protein n=1 Tax=Xiphophorus couchianus TaxID=32473 RepID=A0A3B5LPN8_9TELE
TQFGAPTQTPNTIPNTHEEDDNNECPVFKQMNRSRKILILCAGVKIITTIYKDDDTMVHLEMGTALTRFHSSVLKKRLNDETC